MRKQVGIYQITNTVNGWVYIGSSIYVSSRLANHMSDLRHNKHCNTTLQADANHYGVDVFTCSILEIMLDTSTNPEITERERYYTELAHRNGNCYNGKVATARPVKGKVCQICGKWHFSQNLCQSHYTDYRNSLKRGISLSAEEYIALRKPNPKKRLSTILKRLLQKGL
jgi:group I intron endonuclease